MGKLIRWIAGILLLALVGWRVYQTAFVEGGYGPDTWMRFIIAGLIIGGMYSLIAIGYTLVYGILFMINFAHGEVMMLGAFGGYFMFELFAFIKAPTASDPNMTFLNAYPLVAVLIAFIVGAVVSATAGFLLERIAYRPLRKAPRLVPLISAIGASIFLQNSYSPISLRPTATASISILISSGAAPGWSIPVVYLTVLLTYTGTLSLVLSGLLMIGLFYVVQKTKLGRSMRAVAENKQAAALMGIDVDDVIGKTFIISGVLAGSAGVMWGIHNGLFNHYVGFLPGIKAFTAAVLGGIGNIPGAMMGGIAAPASSSPLGLQFWAWTSQLNDVIAFTDILILVLIFRPSGLLGEALSEEKV